MLSSIDGLLDKSKRDTHVPLWNYFILKYQFFLLYFLAGLKKSDVEWLEGYAMTSLGSHWVFDPFKCVHKQKQRKHFNTSVFYHLQTKLTNFPEQHFFSE